MIILCNPLFNVLPPGLFRLDLEKPKEMCESDRGIFVTNSLNASLSNLNSFFRGSRPQGTTGRHTCSWTLCKSLWAPGQRRTGFFYSVSSLSLKLGSPLACALREGPSVIMLPQTWLWCYKYQFLIIRWYILVAQDFPQIQIITSQLLAKFDLTITFAEF